MKKNIFLISIFLFIILNFNHINAKTQNIKNIDNYLLNKSEELGNFKKIEIQVLGLKRVKKAMIENVVKNSIIKLSQKKPHKEELANHILKSLYHTNLFQDVKINLNHNTLEISVIENKIIRNLIIKDLKELKNEELKKLTENHNNTIFNEYNFNQLIKELNEYYLENGYLNIEITKEIKNIDKETIDIILKIKKNKKPKINQIQFIGNKHFSKGELVENIFFQEYSLIKFFNPKTSYKKDLEEMNNESLKNFYLNRGFIDFKLINNETVFDPIKNKTKLIIEFEEGNKYKIKKININNFNNQLNQNLTNKILKNEGEIYNHQKLIGTTKQIKRELNKKKIYAEIEIENKKIENNQIIVTFNIKPIKSNYIEKIIIIGNTRTKDSVIRNQILLHEGDILDINLIQSSYRRIYNLGFFETVNLDYKEDENGKIILIINVLEKKTGEAKFKFGYSTINKAYGGLEYVQNNFLGNGNKFDISMEKSAQNIGISSFYYKNNLLESMIGGGIGFFYEDKENEQLDYKEMEYGGRLVTSFPIYEDLNLALRYTLKTNEIYDIGESASQYTKDHHKKDITSAFMHKFTYDKRNITDYPTNGYLFSVSQDISGLGGDKYFVSNEASAQLYKTLFYYNNSQDDRDAVVLQLKTYFGRIFDYNNYNLQIDDRYFLTKVRGFEIYSGISPKDSRGKSLGGDEYYFGTAQIEFPIKFLQDFNLKGHIFMDYGNLISKKKLSDLPVDIKDEIKFNVDKIRLAMGVGFSIETPFAPIGIDFSLPILYDKSDVLKYVYFTIGKNF
jgi:outer membrane protein insertion porin family